MNVREFLLRSDAVQGLTRDWKKIPVLKRQFVRGRHIKRYLESHAIKKLQLGAGPTALPGWLCTDVSPDSAHSVHLDATQRFPFAENTFDYVFSEHMIEHLSWQDGLFKLKECFRILKPGGTIRIATPDLAVLIGLYDHKDNVLGQRYIEWITDNYMEHIDTYKASFVINNAFHCWGHQFLYDGDLLEMAMREAGFTNIRRCSQGESADEQLRDIESHGKNVDDDDMARFETMVYEGDCPA
jgi:predicted SAM-dependent methyltransferase